MDSLENLNINNKVISLLLNYINQFRLFDNVYLFGSILQDSEYQNDVDILLIYSSKYDEIFYSIESLRNNLERLLKLPIDFTILSVEEEKELLFLKRLAGKYIQLK